MIKTRLQIQNELIKQHIILNNKNLPHGMFRIGVNLGKKSQFENFPTFIY